MYVDYNNAFRDDSQSNAFWILYWNEKRIRTIYLADFCIVSSHG